jgi:signal recognition particle receptor subunit beta
VTRAKVLVVGAGEAGKSTLIRALVPEAVNLSVNGRTVAMDHATLRRGSSSLSLVGVPGQQRFAPVREVLTAGTWCVVWVHRAGQAPDLDTAHLVMDLARHHVPFLVFVNRHGADIARSGWTLPPGLPPPRGVFAGDPVARPDGLEPLCEGLWRMVDERARQEKKGA